jgi:hypothetical protein
MLRRSWLAAAAAAAAQSSPWRPLFDGKSLAGWQPVAFDRAGEVSVRDGVISLAPGAPFTGIRFTGPLPEYPYEIRYEARRTAGNDFFASLTFPVANSHATFVTGGWGGDIVGISSIDGWDAADNETRNYFEFENGLWYTFLLAVSLDLIRVSIGGKSVVRASIAGRAVSLRPGPTKLTTPLGFMSYNTAGELRKIEIRRAA